MTDGDFYEEDEPPEKIHAAFEAGEQGMTFRNNTVSLEPGEYFIRVPLDISDFRIEGCTITGS